MLAQEEKDLNKRDYVVLFYCTFTASHHWSVMRKDQFDDSRPAIAWLKRQVSFVGSQCYCSRCQRNTRPTWFRVGCIASKEYWDFKRGWDGLEEVKEAE